MSFRAGISILWEQQQEVLKEAPVLDNGKKKFYQSGCGPDVVTFSQEQGL